MRLYEEVFIVKPDASEEEAKGVVDLLSKTVTDQGGAIEKIDEWGRRNLAYKVGRYTEGIYYIVKFSAQPDTVKEVERRLRVNDFIVKFLTVRLDERLKWVEKRKKRREERAKRKPPVPVSPLPAAPAAALPGQPEAPKPAVPAAPEPVAAAETTETNQ